MCRCSPPAARLAPRRRRRDGADGEIHAVAPGAGLAFCGPNTFVEYTSCLGQLIAAGATVLVDDIIFPGEDVMSTNSTNAQAIGQLLIQNPNVAMFTSAGNYTGSYWEGPTAPCRAPLR